MFINIFYRIFCRKHFHAPVDVIWFIKTQLQYSGALHGYKWIHNKCKEHGLLERRGRTVNPGYLGSRLE